MEVEKKWRGRSKEEFCRLGLLDGGEFKEEIEL